MHKAIFLDRDGTINVLKGNLGDSSKVELIDGVTDGLNVLVAAGWLLIVVTNQPGVALGLFSEDEIHQVHAQLDTLIEQKTGEKLIHHYAYCCWHPEGTVPTWTGNHPNRKPAPGMLLETAKQFGIDLHASWMIGDSVQDVQAGLKAGCQTVWLREPNTSDTITPTFYAPTLVAAAPLIIAHAAVYNS